MILAAKKYDLDQMLSNSLWWLLLVAVLLIGIWVIVLIRTRYRGREDHSTSAHLMLSQFGDLHREGDLTDDEFRSIKSRLVNKLEGSLLDTKSRDQENSNDCENINS